MDPIGATRTGRTVLFLCVENAGRSLMAETLFNADPPPGWTAISAGTAPAARPEPRVRRMLEEIGVSPTEKAPVAVTPEMLSGAALRITMGCLDSPHCPARLREVEVTDWALPDPARLDDEGFRRVRDEIHRRVRALVRELTATGRAEGRSPARGQPT